MANIAEVVIASGVQNEVDDRWRIVGAHLFPSVVPILHINQMIVNHVALAEPSTTAVSHPNIIPSFGQHKGWRLVRCIEDPLRHISSHTVLEENWWACTWNSPDVEDKLIFGDNLVHLSEIPILIADLIKGFESVGSMCGIYRPLLRLSLDPFNKRHKHLFEFPAHETEVRELLSPYD